MRRLLAATGIVAIAWGVAAAGATEIDAPRLFHDLDRNGDGRLHRNEVGPEHRLLFSRLVRSADGDGDGWLTADEFAAGLEPMRAEKRLVEKQGSRLPGADALVVMMVRMDVDGDRQLEPKEIPTEYLRLFEQMLRAGDSDKNGDLNAREIAKAAPRLGLMCQAAAARAGIDVAAEMKKLPGEMAASVERMDVYGRPAEMMADPERARELFARFDANGDKFVSLEEAPEPFAPRFSELLKRGDSDGDGRANLEEFLEIGRRVAAFESTEVDPQAVRRMARQMVKRLDADGDGQISSREAPPRLAEQFERVDRDANGRLDRVELESVAALMDRAVKAGARRRGPDPAEVDAEEPLGRKRDKAAKKAADKSRDEQPPK